MEMVVILEILEKYLTEGQKRWPFWAEHDIIGFNVGYEQISANDLQNLELLGVFYSEEYDSLMMFV